MYAIKTEMPVVNLHTEVPEFELYRSTSKALEAWACWRWEGHGADVGFPSQSPFRRMMVVEGEANLPSIPISDDLAVQIDAAVSQLKLRSFPVKGDYRYISIIEAYLGGFKDHQIGGKHHVSSSKIRTSRIAGENWIESRLLTDLNLNEN